MESFQQKSQRSFEQQLKTSFTSIKNENQVINEPKINSQKNFSPNEKRDEQSNKARTIPG